LDKVLNQDGILRKGGEESTYFCFGCNHHKRKLEINIRTQEWHCWICNSRGRTISSLFYKLKTKEQHFEELYRIIGRNWKRSECEQIENQLHFLPDEFIPLWKSSKSDDYGAAMSYLQKRNVSMDEIIRYNIGYCENGIYKKRIVIPSYDKDGNVNFFAARSYVESYYKYMLPPWSKSIVGFELFINWNESTGITLCEGTFDALAIKNNVIPLFGTTLNLSLKLAIIKNRVKRVNIVLDNDALKQAIDIYDGIEDLQVNKIDIHLVKLGDKDPSVIGFEAINEQIYNSKVFDFSDIVRAKLNS